jgi:quercetin dioxygenase-like cupin family protein
VRGRGWVPAKELVVGDLLCSHDGRWHGVEAVSDEAIACFVGFRRHSK